MVPRSLALAVAPGPARMDCDHPARPSPEVTLQARTRVSDALKLLALGLRPFPVNPDTKKPLAGWGSLQDTPTTEEEVTRTFVAHPAAAIGLVTGHPGGLDVIDLDVDAEGNLPEWPRDPDLKLPTGLVIVTPRGGRHYAFAHVDGVRNSAGALAPHVDVRGTGGYFVAVGPGREILLGSFEEALNTQAPPWLARALLGGAAGTPRAQASLIFDEGERNASLTRLAGVMRRQGMGVEAITAALSRENAARCSPPLPDKEVRAIAQSVGRYPPADSAYRCTDSGNSQRFVAQWKDRVRWCAPLNRWLVWDGSRWAEDKTERLMDMAKRTARSIYVEAGATQDDARRSELGRWARLSEQAGRLQAMVKLAKPDLAILPNALDADPMLLNCTNGTLDLRTGSLRAHAPEDLVTKLVPVEYDPEATCPRWEGFLERTFQGDPDLIRFVQRAVGYTLTGSGKEQVLFLLYGTGANGKSTFLEALRALLGEYGRTSGSGTFLEKGRSGVPNDIARLAGARLVTAQEVEGGARFAEAAVKQLTGSDTIQARFLYAEYFEFRPEFKLFLAANHKPVIRGTDHAIWRRIRLIPFSVTIPDAEQDKNLIEKVKEELPGILTWAIRGCLDWQGCGLGSSAAIASATGEYRAESDILGGFLSECCVIGSEYTASASDLYTNYKAWAERNGEPVASQTAFGRQLGERGFRKTKKSGHSFWKGLGRASKDSRDSRDTDHGKSLVREV